MAVNKEKADAAWEKYSDETLFNNFTNSLSSSI